MTRKIILYISLTAVMLVLATSLAIAQTGGGFDLSWHTIDSGGGSGSGSSFTLNGTVGQPDAGRMTGGGYSLSGGFWPAGAASYTIYLPLSIRE